jgi:drug/metabolite transporter (DMT)-like permease
MNADTQAAGSDIAGAVPLFIACSAIWGSTWLVITFQLGVVPAEVSVVWRFLLAGLVLLGFCAATRRPLAFSRSDHALFAAQGTLMFGLNYICVYWAEQHIVSGLVAVAFSTITFMSLFGQRLTFGTPITGRATLGALLGVGGVAVLFLPELLASHGDRETLVGTGFALAGTVFAALGNMVAGRVGQRQLPVLSSSGFGMLYGAAAAALLVTCTGVPWAFDPRPAYIASLVYLALAGTVAAFVCYLTLMRKVGMANASYVGIATPVVALALSALAEGYRFTVFTAVGIALAIAGNLIVLRRR